MDEEMPADSRPPPEGRPEVGAGLAAAPHVLVVVLMCMGVNSAEGSSRGYAGLYGLLELFIVPSALVVALVVRGIPRFRSWSAPIAAVTTVCAVVVILLTLVVVNGSTWTSTKT
ncbi:hypothetical protein [Actinoplanes sp. NPDC026670]|uniref:hypothetical protein n=1 Tax=Actinoplanes sp. NPDC026670 TaxID=3154700 RepID=UPI0033F8E8FA